MKPKCIMENKVQCMICNSVVVSDDPDEVVSCRCGNVQITGGYEKLKRINIKEGIDYKELSQFYITE